MFGCGISAGVQMSIISSSCSFAALAASRSVSAKGAHLMNGTGFLIASTGLTAELALALLGLLSWHLVLRICPQELGRFPVASRDSPTLVGASSARR